MQLPIMSEIGSQRCRTYFVFFKKKKKTVQNMQFKKGTV